jgi:hypothetical protein
MTSRQWRDDDEFMAELAQTSRSVAVPEAVLRAARAAFGRRLADPERVIAAIGYDSALDDELAMRGGEPDDRRIVSFNAESISVEIELSADRLVGQLVPPMAAEVELATTEGTFARTTADDVGCFRLERPPPGPVQFRCRLSTGVVVTDWVLL